MAAADLLCLADHRTYGLPVKITRSTNNFGRSQHPEELIPLLVTNALRDRPLPLYGDGLHVRDWLYVEDHCTALDIVRREGRPGGLYNVGAGNERTNLDIARAILRLLGKPEGLLRFVEDRPGHDRRHSVDASRLRALGWRPRHPFEAALGATVEWYRRREDWWLPLVGGQRVMGQGGLEGGVERTRGPRPPPPHFDAPRVVEPYLAGRRRLLDLGAGGGQMTLPLLARGHAVVAADLNGRVLANLRLRGAAADLHVLRLDLDAGVLPFRPAAFDAVLASHVLEHLAPAILPRLLADIARVLRPGGRFVAIVPNCGPSYTRDLLGNRTQGREDPGHRSFFTLDRFARLLDGPLELERVFTYPTPGLWRVSPLVARLTALRYGNHIYGIARRPPGA